MTTETIEVNDSAPAVSASHDSFFKASMQHVEIARDFLKAHLPAEIVQQVQLETLKPMPKSFVDNQHRMLISDMLYSVHIENQPGYIYILIEHQTKPLRLMPYRLLKYLFAICDEHLKKQAAPQDKKNLPVIVPLVFYAGRRSPYPYSTDIYSCFENPELAKKVLLEPFKLVDVTTLSDERLLEQGYAAILQLLLKHIHEREILPVIQLIKKRRLLVQIMDIGTGEYRRIVLKYVTDKAETEDEGQVIELLADPITEAGEEIMTIAEKLRQKGRQEGRQQGRQEGEHMNAEKIAKRLLAMGELSSEKIAAITELSIDEVKALQAANQ